MPSPSTLLRSMLGIDDNPNRADASTPTPAQSHLAPSANSTRNLKSSAQTRTTAIRRTRSSSWGDVRVTDTFTQATGAAELDELDDSVCEALYINAALRSRGLSYVCATASTGAAADESDDSEATATVTSEEVLAGSLQASIQGRPAPPSTRIGTLGRPVHAAASPSRRPSITGTISDKAPPAVPSESLGQNPAALRKTASASSLRLGRPRPLPAIPQAAPRPALRGGPSVPASLPDEGMPMDILASSRAKD
uniref:Uncharacterized protein n=1 Tax=Mycena chlorophos TaxID=658473 RepID=A0ABQ0L2I8_MYCCL|nr:predicted protein [Mycena chlorophos]